MQSGDVSPIATVVLGEVGAEMEQSAHGEVIHAAWAHECLHELTPLTHWILD